MTIRCLLATWLCASLSGCALPPMVQMVSWGATGVSYVTTGKGLSEHALSAALQRDCAVVHILNNEEFCLPSGAPESVAQTLPAHSKTRGAGDNTPALHLSSDVQVFDPGAPSDDAPAPVSLRVDASLLERPELYLVQASFGKRAGAEAYRARRGSPDTVIAHMQVRGTPRFLVARGPYGKRIADLTDRNAGAAALAGGRPIWLCPTSLIPPPCGRAVAGTGGTRAKAAIARFEGLVISATPQ